MTTGEKIKELRKSLGLTQTELGKKLGVQKNAVSKWECGRVDDIPPAKIKALAVIFSVPVSYLIDDGHAVDCCVDDFVSAMAIEAKYLTESDKQLLLFVARHLNAARNL